MLAYRVKSKIDEHGSLAIHNLPVKDKDQVEVILLIQEQKSPEVNVYERIKRFISSFGTISSDAIISDVSLQREHLYENEGR